MNNSTSSNNNNNGNNASDFVVAAVALVVSVVALLATFMQVLQQYYASAQGYSQCNEKVMGLWAKTKSRQFRWDELRFEVHFDAPVIFLSPPSNTLGPIADAPIYFLDGSEESLNKTETTSEINPRKEYSEKTERERIHTADNERASWFNLLCIIQGMEKKSREWQEAEYKSMGPPAEPLREHLPRTPPTLKEHHTLVVALQRKRKSWDTMPTTVTKPYATTTMCHLIEMMAALGVYWKEFDRKRDRYWAEGNGFMVLGERISDLGLMFSFQISGQGEFKRNRVIPVDEIKELCFGFVPTIYREKLDQRRLKPPSDEQNLSSLFMGSSREIAETLTAIGCNHNTVRYFLDENKRTSHLFPISFEIVGMLSRTFHIENSSFTFIPNPTPDLWDRRALSLSKMMRAYGDKLVSQSSSIKQTNVIVSHIKNHIESILSYDPDKNGLQRQLFLRALHIALDDTDEILTAKTKKRPQLSSSTPAGQSLEVPSDQNLDSHRPEQRREIVQDVLRHHIQEVLRLLNSQSDRTSDGQPVYLDVVPRSPSLRPMVMTSQFEDMNAAGPDERQEIFMNVYFSVIRQRVVEHAAGTTTRRNSGSNSIRSNASPRTSVHIVLNNTTTSPAMLTDGAAPDEDENGLRERELDSSTLQEIQKIQERQENQETQNITLADQDVSHDDIWCTLVFRMICWLMLHDFHKKDIQLSKSELLGSRMPVYIS
ncbi:hypothetical protein PT974_01896 [Cladobotryum mycophilum]|uniref:Modin n=1 Tax=Cladobotryum mycophilum TaxID=491253 RepID=A0ABR0SX11_9HYPO